MSVIRLQVYKHVSVYGEISHIVIDDQTETTANTNTLRIYHTKVKTTGHQDPGTAPRIRISDKVKKSKVPNPKARTVGPSNKDIRQAKESKNPIQKPRRNSCLSLIINLVNHESSSRSCNHSSAEAFSTLLVIRAQISSIFFSASALLGILPITTVPGRKPSSGIASIVPPRRGGDIAR